MLEPAPQLVPELDWDNIILEVQTYPDQGLSDAHWQLYAAIYGFMTIAAHNWLKVRNLTEAEEGNLVSIGIDKIFCDICKFTIPNDCSSGIGKAFKAWSIKCCKREWGAYESRRLEDCTDPYELQQLDNLASPSPEDIAINHQTPEAPSRSHAERDLMKTVLQEELDRLPPSMKDALLETEDIKSVERPQARGKQGEAARIASKYGYTAGALRTTRSRLLQKVNERFEEEVKKL